MAIRETTDVDGPVVLIDTIDDYHRAIATYDLPIIVPPELVDALGLRGAPDDPSLLADLLDSPHKDSTHTPSKDAA